jgi:hypothetical protein
MQQSWQEAKEKSSQTNLNSNDHKIKTNLLLMVNKKLNVK